MSSENRKGSGRASALAPSFSRNASRPRTGHSSLPSSCSPAVVASDSTNSGATLKTMMKCLGFSFKKGRS